MTKSPAHACGHGGNVGLRHAWWSVKGGKQRIFALRSWSTCPAREVGAMIACPTKGQSGNVMVLSSSSFKISMGTR